MMYYHKCESYFDILDPMFKYKGIIPNKEMKGIVILMHGYGASYEDMMVVCKNMHAAIPNVGFFALNAPHSMASYGYHGGFKWFDIEWPQSEGYHVDPGGNYRDKMVGYMEELSEELCETINKIRAKYDLPAEKLIIGGFSQGSILSMHMGLQHVECKGVIGFSGPLMLKSDNKMSVKYRPDIALIHGNRDHIFPVFTMEESQRILKENSVDVSLRILDMEHTINERAVAIGCKFVIERLL